MAVTIDQLMENRVSRDKAYNGIGSVAGAIAWNIYERQQQIERRKEVNEGKIQWEVKQIKEGPHAGLYYIEVKKWIVPQTGVAPSGKKEDIEGYWAYFLLEDEPDTGPFGNGLSVFLGAVKGTYDPGATPIIKYPESTQAYYDLLHESALLESGQYDELYNLEHTSYRHPDIEVSQSPMARHEQLADKDAMNSRQEYINPASNFRVGREAVLFSSYEEADARANNEVEEYGKHHTLDATVKGGFWGGTLGWLYSTKTDRFTHIIEHKKGKDGLWRRYEIPGQPATKVFPRGSEYPKGEKYKFAHQRGWPPLEPGQKPTDWESGKSKITKLPGGVSMFTEVDEALGPGGSRPTGRHALTTKEYNVGVIEYFDVKYGYGEKYTNVPKGSTLFKPFELTQDYKAALDGNWRPAYEARIEKLSEIFLDKEGAAELEISDKSQQELWEAKKRYSWHPSVNSELPRELFVKRPGIVRQLINTIVGPFSDRPDMPIEAKMHLGSSLQRAFYENISSSMRFLKNTFLFVDDHFRLKIADKYKQTKENDRMVERQKRKAPKLNGSGTLELPMRDFRKLDTTPHTTLNHYFDELSLTPDERKLRGNETKFTVSVKYFNETKTGQKTKWYVEHPDFLETRFGSYSRMGGDVWLEFDVEPKPKHFETAAVLEKEAQAKYTSKGKLKKPAIYTGNILLDGKIVTETEALEKIQGRYVQPVESKFVTTGNVDTSKIEIKGRTPDMAGGKYENFPKLFLERVRNTRIKTKLLVNNDKLGTVRWATLPKNYNPAWTLHSVGLNEMPWWKRILRSNTKTQILLKPFFLITENFIPGINRWEFMTGGGSESPTKLPFTSKINRAMPLGIHWHDDEWSWRRNTIDEIFVKKQNIGGQVIRKTSDEVMWPSPSATVSDLGYEARPYKRPPTEHAPAYSVALGHETKLDMTTRIVVENNIKKQWLFDAMKEESYHPESTEPQVVETKNIESIKPRVGVETSRGRYAGTYPRGDLVYADATWEKKPGTTNVYNLSMPAPGVPEIQSGSGLPAPVTEGGIKTIAQSPYEMGRKIRVAQKLRAVKGGAFGLIFGNAIGKGMDYYNLAKTEEELKAYIDLGNLKYTTEEKDNNIIIYREYLTFGNTDGAYRGREDIKIWEKEEIAKVPKGSMNEQSAIEQIIIEDKQRFIEQWYTNDIIVDYGGSGPPRDTSKYTYAIDAAGDPYLEEGEGWETGMTKIGAMMGLFFGHGPSVSPEVVVEYEYQNGRIKPWGAAKDMFYEDAWPRSIDGRRMYLNMHTDFIILSEADFYAKQATNPQGWFDGKRSNEKWPAKNTDHLPEWQQKKIEERIQRLVKEGYNEEALREGPYEMWSEDDSFKFGKKVIPKALRVPDTLLEYITGRVGLWKPMPGYDIWKPRVKWAEDADPFEVSGEDPWSATAQGGGRKLLYVKDGVLYEYSTKGVLPWHQMMIVPSAKEIRIGRFPYYARGWKGKDKFYVTQEMYDILISQTEGYIDEIKRGKRYFNRHGYEMDVKLKPEEKAEAKPYEGVDSKQVKDVVSKTEEVKKQDERRVLKARNRMHVALAPPGAKITEGVTVTPKEQYLPGFPRSEINYSDDLSLKDIDEVDPKIANKTELEKLNEAKEKVNNKVRKSAKTMTTEEIMMTYKWYRDMLEEKRKETYAKAQGNYEDYIKTRGKNTMADAISEKQLEDVSKLLERQEKNILERVGLKETKTPVTTEGREIRIGTDTYVEPAKTKPEAEAKPNVTQSLILEKHIKDFKSLAKGESPWLKLWHVSKYKLFIKREWELLEGKSYRVQGRYGGLIDKVRALARDSPLSEVEIAKKHFSPHEAELFTKYTKYWEPDNQYRRMQSWALMNQADASKAGLETKFYDQWIEMTPKEFNKVQETLRAARRKTGEVKRLESKEITKPTAEQPKAVTPKPKPKPVKPKPAQQPIRPQQPIAPTTVQRTPLLPSPKAITPTTVERTPLLPAPKTTPKEVKPPQMKPPIPSKPWYGAIPFGRTMASAGTRAGQALGSAGARAGAAFPILATAGRGLGAAGRGLGTAGMWMMSEGTMRRPAGARLLSPFAGMHTVEQFTDNPYAQGAGAVAGYAAPLYAFGGSIGADYYSPYFEMTGMSEERSRQAGALAGMASMRSPYGMAATLGMPVLQEGAEHVLAPAMGSFFEGGPRRRKAAEKINEFLWSAIGKPEYTGNIPI